MTSREHRELAQTLNDFAAFAQCTQDDLQALAQEGRVTSLPANWTFLHEGTPADACYVLLSGQARVRISGTDRTTLGPGAVLGEMALLGHKLRSASVVSSEPVKALRVEYDALAKLLDSRPGLKAAFDAIYESHRTADAAPEAPAGS